MSYMGRLPWPKLKRENGYFHSTSKSVTSEGTMNAVIMGYKTWDKEPMKYYPDRINVVVTREPDKALARIRGDPQRGFVHVARDVENAIMMLERMYSYPPERMEEARNENSSHANNNFEGEIGHGGNDDKPYLGRIFVIGGAGLCRDALEIPCVNRLLLTRVMVSYKSDTFFPIPLDGSGNGQWKRQSDESFRKWGGSNVPIGVQSENGIEWETFMFEKVEFSTRDYAPKTAF